MSKKCFFLKDKAGRGNQGKEEWENGKEGVISEAGRDPRGACIRETLYREREDIDAASYSLFQAIKDLMKKLIPGHRFR